MDQQAEKKKDRKNNRIRQKNKRGDSKVESNDSPEIPDRGQTSDIPGLPSGDSNKQQQNPSRTFMQQFAALCTEVYAIVTVTTTSSLDFSCLYPVSYSLTEKRQQRLCTKTEPLQQEPGLNCKTPIDLPRTTSTTENILKEVVS